MMTGRVVSDDPDEFFVMETNRTTSETKTVRLEIHDFTEKLKDEYFKKEPIMSPTFDIVGKKLAISIDPEEQNSGGIAIYLRNQDKDKITATCTINGILKTMMFEKKEVGPGKGIGFPCFVSHGDFKKWSERNVDLKLDLTVTLHFSENSSGWTNKGKPKIYFDPLELALEKCNIREDKILQDFNVLSKDGQKFPCHRIFLASQSPVMMAMMTHDMKETQESEVKLDYNGEIVKHFVEYFYTGTVPQRVLQENLESFLQLSESYDLTRLKFQTEEAGIDMLTVENMVEIFALADHYCAYKLLEVSEFLIKTNRKALKNQDLSEVPQEVFAAIFKMLC